MFKEPSFLKKANLFQPILVVVISIIGGTPMEGANTGKIVLLIILGAAFHCMACGIPETAQQKPGNQGTCLRPEKPQCGSLQKNLRRPEQKKQKFNKLNGESCREAKTDGSRGRRKASTEPACSCAPPLPLRWLNIKTPLSLKCFIFRQSEGRAETLLHVTGYAQGEHNNDTPSLLAQPPRPVTKTPAMLDEQLFAERRSAPWFFPARKKCSAAFSGSATHLRRKNTCSIWPFPS